MPDNTSYLPPKNTKSRDGLGEGAHLLLIIVLSMLTLFSIQYARDIVLPIIIASFLAIISYSITDVLRRYLRLPHWLAVILTVLIDFGVIFGIISLINFLAGDLKDSIQGDLALRFAAKYTEIMNWLDKFGLADQARAMVKSPQELFDTQQMLGLIQTLTGKILSIMSITAVVLILMTFFLGEAPLFKRNMEKLTSSDTGKEQVLRALLGIQRYLFIKTISSLCTGALAWLLCASMNVPFAFLWGVLAYVLNYIPTFGSIVAAIPPILLAWLMNSWGDGFIVMAGYVFINFMIGNGIEPLFLGKQFGIATTVVLLSVILWGWVLGPVGMLLAVPITVLIKLAFENSKDLSWMAIMISDETESKLPISKQ